MVLVSSLVLAWCWCGSAGARPSPGVVLRPLVLHPQFTHLRGSQLVFSQRYVFISGLPYPPGTGVLIDGRSAARRSVARSGCTPSALGGRWLAFTCGGYRNTSFALYNIGTRRFQDLTVKVPYGLCSTNCLPIAAIGNYWVAVQADPFDAEHGLPSYSFQNLATSQVVNDPTTPTTDVDLDAPGLTKRVCRPLQVPRVTSDRGAGWGSLAFTGGYAIASGSGGAYLERCGSELHQFLTFTTPAYNYYAHPACPHLDCPPAHNSREIIWESAAGRLSGVFLPTRRRFTIPLPPEVEPHTGFAQHIPLVLTDKRLYILTRQYEIWSTTVPAEPTRHR